MRAAGILMPIFSLPSPYGIGTLGKEAREFVDFLEKAGQKYWQLLPICPTSYGDSPYQSFSSFAGNPYFIDLKQLIKDRLLTEEECSYFDWGGDAGYVDYESLFLGRFPLFFQAYERFVQKLPDDYEEFCERESGWLEEYALFMALKDAHEGKAWGEWEDAFKHRDPSALDKFKKEHKREIDFYRMLQYLYDRQWKSLKAYANQKGIQIIGDLPIYVSLDSADVWSEPTQFYLNEKLDPIEVAGCPPDAFAVDGQLWGNPLFRWDVMKADGYGWWMRRIEAMKGLYDIIRIDHFRGFDSYYAIPFGEKTARKGVWKKGPGMDLFSSLEKKFGTLPIIVEDLGFLTDSVKQLLADSGFPGMKVLQFAFDPDHESEYLPHNYTKDCVVYTGTHDNDTIMGWLSTADERSVSMAKSYLNLTKEEGYHWGLMRGAWASVADTAIVPIQDILGLGSEARINVPSTLGENWKWRIREGSCDDRLATKINRYMRLFFRER